MGAARETMSPLSAEELGELRKHIEGFPMSDAEKDEMIALIDRIVVSFILQARRLDPVQLSLSARANAEFDGDRGYGMNDYSDVTKRIDLGDSEESEGEIEQERPTQNPRRILEP
jgi:hypothetical protein